MATKIGPKTVTQRDRSKNLVFCIDAAHSDSYGGEPTVNNQGNNLSAHTEGDSTATYADAPEKGPGWKKITITARGTNHRVSKWSYVTTSGVSKITLSVEYDMALGNSSGYYWKTDGSGGHSSTSQDESNKKRVFTVYSADSTARVVAIFLANNSTGVTGLNDVIYYRYYQAETKDHSSPYTATSRTATTAIRNISGVGAQGTNWIQGSAADTYGQELVYHSDGYSLGTQDGRSVPRTRKVLRTRDPNQGHIGGAYWDLDGTDEGIDCYDMNEETGTLAFWMKSTFSGSSSYPFGKQKGTETLAMSMHSANSPSHSGDFWVRNTAGGSSSVQTTAALNDGVWHQVVAMWGVGGLKIYVDGEFNEGDTTFTGHGNAASGDSNFGLGCILQSGGPGYETPGQFATLMVWSSQLTSKEVKDIYIAQKGRFGK